jgi:predicted porin
MQKKLIALAVAGMASTAAFAQSNVTIYGLLQPSYDFMSIKGGAGATGDIGNMTYNNSRIGFKGEEALGNGLKAIFQIESKVDLVDRGDDAGGLADRDSFVGLAGGFGSLTFGNHQTAYKKVADFADPFADSIGDYNNIMALTGTGQDFNRRVRKSAYYVSPNWAGFQLAASYAMGAAVTDIDGAGKTDESVLSLGANYKLAGFNLMAAYEQQALKDEPNAATQAKLIGWKVGAGYKFSFGTSVAAIYENLSQDANANSTGLDRNAWFLSAVHPLTSNFDLMASYAQAGDNKEIAGEQGARNYNLGVNYKLSKRTSVQGVYTHLKNKEDGAYFIDSAGYGDGNVGSKVSGFSVRLRHAF